MSDEKMWQCPKCACTNTDNDKVTVFPMCADCGQSFEWLEILPNNRVHTDAGGSAVSTCSFQTSAYATSQTVTQPTQRG